MHCPPPGTAINFQPAGPVVNSKEMADPDLKEQLLRVGLDHWLQAELGALVPNQQA
jgi:hypothetical protein